MAYWTIGSQVEDELSDSTAMRLDLSLQLRAFFLGSFPEKYSRGGLIRGKK